MKVDFDLIIIGGGIMGLWTAGWAIKKKLRVALVDKQIVGNPSAASSGLTRSFRQDYLDSFYGALAVDSRKFWVDFEREVKQRIFVKCGVLNVAKREITPRLEDTYAFRSYRALRLIGARVAKLNRIAMERSFPQFRVDLGVIDQDGGYIEARRVTKIFKNLLRDRIAWREKTRLRTIQETRNGVIVEAANGIITSSRVVIVCGVWTNEVLRLIKGAKKYLLPITPLAPPQTRYYLPASQKRNMFSAPAFPVFAYLDVGLYGHPHSGGPTPGVKIGNFRPPQELAKVRGNWTSRRLIATCLPTLQGAKIRKSKDRCLFDLSPDQDFIVGKLPGLSNIFVGAGWNGTGYKFAPLIGKYLIDLVTKGKSSYDFRRFDPRRFSGNRL